MNIYLFLLNQNKEYIRKIIFVFILYIIYALSEIYLFSYLISTVLRSLNKNISYINIIFKNIVIGLIFYLLTYYIYRYVHINTMVKFKIDIRK